jgi:hypothetical protein
MLVCRVSKHPRQCNPHPQWSEYVCGCGHNIALRMFYGVGKINYPIQNFVFSIPVTTAGNLPLLIITLIWPNIFKYFLPKNVLILAYGNLAHFGHSHFRELVKQDNKIMSNHNHPSSSFAMPKRHSSAKYYISGSNCVIVNAIWIYPIHSSMSH